MSTVRRFFCLFVAFDLFFISMLWFICIMVRTIDSIHQGEIEKIFVHLNPFYFIADERWYYFECPESTSRALHNTIITFRHYFCSFHSFSIAHYFLWSFRHQSLEHHCCKQSPYFLFNFLSFFVLISSNLFSVFALHRCTLVHNDRFLYIFNWKSLLL